LLDLQINDAITDLLNDFARSNFKHERKSTPRLVVESELPAPASLEQLEEVKKTNEDSIAKTENFCQLA